MRAGKVFRLLRRGRPIEPLSSSDVDYLRRLYDAEIRGVDAELGRIFRLLDSPRHRAETIVILTSDHGEEFLEHGGMQHGYRLYEELLRIPMIIRAPGVPPSRIVDGPASHVDLAPTVLELLGVPVPESFQGRSLASRIRGVPGFRIPPVLSETRYEPEAPQLALRGEQWKLIRHPASGRLELYDLAADPGEQVDLAGKRPRVAARLDAELSRRLEGLAAIEVPDAVQESDPELEAQLRELGYLD